MRAPVHTLALCGLVSLAGCVGSARHEGFTATDAGAFLYSAKTSTVMTENDDGTSERLRRRWIADALQAHGMCGDGYVVDTRSYLPNADGRFGNGGEILYKGRCLSNLPPQAPLVVEEKRQKKIIVEEKVPES